MENTRRHSLKLPLGFYSNVFGKIRQLIQSFPEVIQGDRRFDLNDRGGAGCVNLPLKTI
jgi:hypothetical protein